MGMKVLSINGYFLLSDDFKGGYQEALEEYVKYRKKNKLSTTPASKKGRKESSQEDLWYSFLDLTSKGKSRFCGNIAVGEWVGSKWKLLHKKKK